MALRRRRAIEEARMLIHGSCHCGNMRFALDWQPAPERIPARACTCSFCMKHGGVWTSCPTGSLEVTVRDPSLLGKYQFATGTADFHVCARCGVVPLVTGELDGRVYAVVNVNTFEDVDPSMLQRAPVSFEGEDQGDRLARRRRNWIPDVRFTTGG
jgi:hypothetical protein